MPIAIMAVGSSASFTSRWKISVQKLLCFFRQATSVADHEPGLKSLFETKLLGLSVRFFGLVPSRSLSADDFVLGVEFVLLEHDGDDFFLELLGQLLRLVLGAAALLDHFLPGSLFLYLSVGLPMYLTQRSSTS